MKNRTNKHFAVEHRRRQIVSLYLQGISQATIAEQLAISQSTISVDLKAIRKQWRESAIRDFDELRSIELEKLHLLECEAWSAWKRSQKPAQSAVVTGEGATQRSTKSMRNQVGDPRFMAIISQCIAQRRGLLALDILPANTPLEDPFDAHVTPEVRRQRVEAMLITFGQPDRISATGEGSSGDQSGQSGDRDEPRTVGTGAASSTA